MAESFSLGPSLFTAAPSQDPKVWLASLRDYVAYKGLNEEKQLALFKLRLGETARDWLMALPDDNKDTFAHLSAAFLARFQPKEIEKYKFARDLFNHKQKPGQSVDAYVTDLRTKAAIVGLDAKSLLYVAISGLSSDIVTYVVQRSPATLDELLTHARVAELSRAHETARADDVVSQQLDHLSQQMCLLTEKMSSMTTATVENRRSRPTTPVDRHVTFSEQRPRSTSPYRRDDAAYRSASQSPLDNHEGTIIPNIIDNVIGDNLIPLLQINSGSTKTTGPSTTLGSTHRHDNKIQHFARDAVALTAIQIPYFVR
jgi:hypothetical protein